MVQAKLTGPGAEPETPLLIEAARAGDRDALGRLFTKCRPYLLLVANSELDAELRAKGGASDLVQESFLEAQQDFADFRGSDREDLLGWLRRILQRNLADFRRRYRGTGQRELNREQALSSRASSGVWQQLIAQTPSPPQRAIDEEQAQAVLAALRRLPAEYAEVIRLRHQERRSFAEVGQALGGRTAEAARKLWFRAVERLRQELGQPHHGSP